MLKVEVCLQGVLSGFSLRARTNIATRYNALKPGGVKFQYVSSTTKDFDKERWTIQSWFLLQQSDLMNFSNVQDFDASCLTPCGIIAPGIVKSSD